MWSRRWRAAQPHIQTVALVAVWDWLTTVSTRYIADQSALAVVFALLLTLFWWLAVGLTQRRSLIWAAGAGAAGGTAAGLWFP